MTYPDIKDKDFYEKIEKKYDRFKIEKKKKRFNDICFPKEFELQVPQKFLSEYINPKSPYKDILIFHRIGAGKTCTAVSIAEKWKSERKIIVAVPASLIGNFRAELRSLCAGNTYLKEAERKILSENHPSSSTYKGIIAKSDERINKVYSIYSYNKFIDLIKTGKLNLHNKVLIIDEIQNMVSEKGTYYKLVYDAIHKGPKDLRVILLSATPMFDKPIEIALTLNLLRLPKQIPIEREFVNLFIKNSNSFLESSAQNLDIFKNMIKGYVSYYRGAPPYVFPESNIKYIKCDMSEFQYRSYLTVLSKEGTNKETMNDMKAFHSGDILELPNNFFLGTRMISNIAFPNKGIDLDGFESLKDSTIQNIEKYSVKFHRILTKMKSASGPVFIYSNFKEYGGIRSFVKVLEGHGYYNYLKHGEGKKRFAVWSGDTSYEGKEEIKAVFNQKENYNASKLKIILGSPSTKEGISFINVRQVHILEPYWNYSRILQIIGRAVRYCSHKQLPEEKRNVKVFIYIATHPNEKLTVDQYILQLALQKNKIIQQFELALKEAAVDCELFKHGNVFPDEGDIKCVGSSSE
jgi:superfamily II DNA or RNA helicase